MHNTIWVNLENTALNEANQTQKAVYHITSFT